MNYEDFETVEFTPRSETVPGFVYILFLKSDGKEVPFYVGQTSRLWGRMDDYYWAMFNAPTDFRVGEVARHLQNTGHKIIIRYKATPEPRLSENQVLEQLRHDKVRLLNDLPGFDYRKSDPSTERARLIEFADSL